MLGEEENFGQAQRHNHAAVEAAMILPFFAVPYEIQSKRFTAYNDKVRKLAAKVAEIGPEGSLGLTHFAVEFLGPYKVHTSPKVFLFVHHLFLFVLCFYVMAFRNLTATVVGLQGGEGTLHSCTSVQSGARNP